MLQRKLACGKQKARKAALLAAGISLRKIALTDKNMNKSAINRSGDMVAYFKGLAKV